MLRQRVNDLRAMVDPLSVDDVWVNPPPMLSRASANIDRLVNEIDDLIQYEVMYIAINRSLHVSQYPVMKNMAFVIYMIYSIVPFCTLS